MKRVFQAVPEELRHILSFVESYLEETGCPSKKKMQIAVAAEEIFVNIAKYAYEDGGGMVAVEMAQEEETLVIRFIDSGRPFNPLAHAEPDFTLPAEERESGGLGIWMVRKMMDSVSYVYEEGQNILEIRNVL